MKRSLAITVLCTAVALVISGQAADVPNSPWCKELNFDTANAVGGFVDSLSILCGISRFDLCMADSDLPGVQAGNKAVFNSHRR